MKQIMQRWTALALIVFGLAAFGANTALAQAAKAARAKVVFQVSDNDPAKWNLALNNARNVQQDLGAENVDLEVVVYGPGIGMLKKDSAVGKRVADALQSKRQGCGLRKHDEGAEAGL